MSVQVLGSYTLAEVNVAGAGALAAVNPLLAQFDLVLATGLGSLMGDISAQLSAALALQAQLTLQVANPLAALQEALRGAVQLVAQISATISAGIPVIAVQANASLGATAALSAKLGGLEALMQGALAVKVPAVNFVGQLAGHLNAGPIALVAIGAGAPDTLSSAGQAINALCQNGIEGIRPSDRVYGLLILTSSPSAWAAIGATMRTS